MVIIMRKKKNNHNLAKTRKMEKDLWFDLLECLTHIINLWPSEKIGADAPIAYISKGAEAIVFFSCIQANESVKIKIIPSVADYIHYLSALTGSCSERDQIEMTYYEVSFSNKQDVPPDLAKVYRRHSIECLDGLWPVILYKRKGYLSCVPDRKGLQCVLDYLKNFTMQLVALEELQAQQQSGKDAPVLPDLRHDCALIRYYDPESGLWLNKFSSFQSLSVLGARVVLNSSPELRRLKGSFASYAVRKVEFDYSWERKLSQDNPSDPPHHNACLVMVNRETGTLLSRLRCRPEDLIEAVFSMWFDVLPETGIPQTLYLCRRETCDILSDFAQRMGIKIKMVKSLPAAERILRQSCFS